jgi:hypothetical protein
MRWIKSAGREILSLFVDDTSFAIAIIVWLGAVWLLSLNVLRGIAWAGVVLFAGFAAILLWSAMRRARH